MNAASCTDRHAVFLSHRLLQLFVFAWLAVINNIPVASAFSASSQQSSTPPPPSPPLILPTNADDIIRQSANSISNAYLNDGKNLQSIRLPLSDTIYGNKEERFVADRAIGWQGGPQETYRYLAPIVTNLLKQIKMTDNTGGLNVKVSEQILLDFDGSSLLTSENPAGALYDIQALLQPNTDGYYLRTIEAIDEQFANTAGKSKRLFLLVNPAWRDKSSWGFFGSKKAQELILDRFETTYALDQFVVRGRRVSLLKCWGENWILFVGNDDDPSLPAERVAEFSGERPEYNDIDAALLKYLG